MGLPLRINANNGQNQFEVHISQNMAKIANLQPKIGQDVTFAPTLNGHNSGIFHLILTFTLLKDQLVETNRIV